LLGDQPPPLKRGSRPKQAASAVARRSYLTSPVVTFRTWPSGSAASDY
jgi:hypothetical protein